MAAIIVGTYDASTWVAGNYATYPKLPAGVPAYQSGMAWYVIKAGTVSGQAVVPGDLLFAAYLPRTYGSYTYGGKFWGYRPNWEDGNWAPDEVYFLKWQGNLPPADLVPYPNAGCPFTPAYGPDGNWAPGWRIVVDCYYDDRATARRYGDFTYGAQTFGGDPVTGGKRWVDITQPSFHIEIGDGMAEGGPRVTVSEVVVQFVDPVGRWFDMATPATWVQPQPGTPLRVGLIDPQFRYHPLISAQIERIEDVHDGGAIREVSVRGFGRIMDLVVDLPQVQRPAELASARFNALATAAGWRWTTEPTVFPSTGNATLVADKQPEDIVARDKMDQSCAAVGWFLDSDRAGRMRVRTWPHVATGTTLDVVDCYGYPGGLVSHSIAYANDQSQLLNYVVTTNTEDPVKQVVVQDLPSVALFGRRGRAFGFPMTGLPWPTTAGAQTWAQRVVDRFAYITRQAESFEVDTGVDPDWLATLADLDTGRGVRISRTGFSPFSLYGVVVGWRWRLDPGRWQGSVFVSTTTKSL